MHPCMLCQPWIHLVEAELAVINSVIADPSFGAIETMRQEQVGIRLEKMSSGISTRFPNWVLSHVAMTGR
jgi:hypothetical protein